MKPLFTEEEKIQSVRTFLIALRHKRAKITSYAAIVNSLNLEQIKPLNELKKSGRDAIYIGAYSTGQYKTYYTNNDAKLYFEWLISAVSGTLPDSIDEKLLKYANDQLFNLIQIMQQSDFIDLDSNIQMIEPYDWQTLFTSFNERLNDMQRIIDKGDKDIIEVLKMLLPQMKENKKLLNQLLKENEESFGR